MFEETLLEVGSSHRFAFKFQSLAVSVGIQHIFSFFQNLQTSEFPMALKKCDLFWTHWKKR